MHLNSEDDVVLAELLQLQAAEMKLTSEFNVLRAAPGGNTSTERFLGMLAELNDRASKVESLLARMPNAIASPQRLVA